VNNETGKPPAKDPLVEDFLKGLLVLCLPPPRIIQKLRDCGNFLASTAAAAATDPLPLLEKVANIVAQA
jgi:hypothetical protein